MKKFAKLIAGVLAVGLLAACGGKTPDPTPSADPSATPEPTPIVTTTAPAAEAAEINLAVLSGPTGVGAAKLMADNDAGETENRYNVTVATDNSQVTALLVNGEVDMAAIATNVASNLYHKTDGDVQIAAINTLGVLYILGPAEEEINSLQDLCGKTLYATGQGANPQYVLDYLLKENDVDPETELDIQWQAADEVTATMLSGKGEWCMLPVPAATALMAKSEGKITQKLSLSEEWDALKNGSQLAMGCIVVRSEFAAENPEAVKTFLAEYAASIEYVRENPEEMAQTVTDYGITPSAAIAQKAIPQCNLVCITGEDMRDTIQGYFEALCQNDAASIGGSIPDDGFYFLGE